MAFTIGGVNTRRNKTNIGPRLYVDYQYGITVNVDAVIGRNCIIHKGVTIR